MLLFTLNLTTAGVTPELPDTAVNDAYVRVRFRNGRRVIILRRSRR